MGDHAMIKAFVVDNDRLRVADYLEEQRDSIVWVDLFNPTKEEETAVETVFGIAVPTREEMEEIEVSSRLYVEDGGYFMTANLPSQTEADKPEMSPVTFALANKRLVTVRYHEPRAFKTFPLRAEKVATGCTSADTILVGLLEAIVDRLADILEKIGRDIETISHDIFEATATSASRRNRDFQELLKSIGRKEDLASSVRDSLISLQRLFPDPCRHADQDGQGQPRPHQDAFARRRFAGRPFRLPVAEDRLPARRHARHDLDRTERHHQDLLGGRRHLPAADAGGIDLRHEFRGDAGIEMAGRLPACHRPDDRVGGAALLVLPPARLALNGQTAAPSPAKPCGTGRQRSK
jgi:Mg2+ and Co2+ transporter CorA